MLLANRMFCQGDGHSLEISGPLQTREHSLPYHSLPVMGRKKGLWTDSAVNRNFTPFCCTITIMHTRSTEKASSYSLEFCPGKLYKINRKLACAVLFLWPEWCPVCLSCVLYVLCHFTCNHQHSRKDICGEKF